MTPWPPTRQHKTNMKYILENITKTRQICNTQSQAISSTTARISNQIDIGIDESPVKTGNRMLKIKEPIIDQHSTI